MYIRKEHESERDISANWEAEKPQYLKRLLALYIMYSCMYILLVNVTWYVVVAMTFSANSVYALKLSGSASFR